MSIEAMKQALDALEWGQPIIEDYGSKEQLQAHLSAKDALYKGIEADMYRNPDTVNPCEGWNPSDMAHRSGGLIVEQEPVAWAETNDMVCALLRQAHDVLACASSSPPSKRDMSTKPQNVYTSAERVQEIDKSIHEDDDIAERAYFAGKEAGVAESEAVKRKWVGLTEKEITTIANKTLTFKQCVQAIEAKLKEKNNG